MKHKWLRCFIAIGLSLAISQSAVWSDTFTYIGASGSDFIDYGWSTSNNWVNNAAPSSDLNNTIVQLRSTNQNYSSMNIDNFQAQEIRFLENHTFSMSKLMTVKSIVTEGSARGGISLGTQSLTVDTTSLSTYQQSYTGNVSGTGNYTIVGNGVVSSNYVKMLGGSFQVINFRNSGANVFLGEAGNEYTVNESDVTTASGKTTITGLMTRSNLFTTGGQTELKNATLRDTNIYMSNGSVIYAGTVDNARIEVTGGNFRADSSTTTNATIVLSAGVYNNSEDSSKILSSTITVSGTGEFQNRGKITSSPIRLEGGKFWNTDQVTNSNITITGGTFYHGSDDDGSILNRSAQLTANTITLSGGRFYSYGNISSVDSLSKVTINVSNNAVMDLGSIYTGSFRYANEQATLSNGVVNLNTGQLFTIGQIQHSEINIENASTLTLGKTSSPIVLPFHTSTISNSVINVKNHNSNFNSFGTLENSTINLTGSMSNNENPGNPEAKIDNCIIFITGGSLTNNAEIVNTQITITPDPTNNSYSGYLETSDTARIRMSEINATNSEIDISGCALTNSTVNLYGEDLDWDDSTNTSFLNSRLTVTDSSLQTAARFENSTIQLKGEASLTFFTNANVTNSAITLYNDSFLTNFDDISNTKVTVFDDTASPDNDAVFSNRGSIDNAGISNEPNIFVYGGRFDNAKTVRNSFIIIYGGEVNNYTTHSDTGTITNTRILGVNGKFENAGNVLNSDITLIGNFVFNNINDTSQNPHQLGTVGGDNYSSGIVYSSLSISDQSTFNNNHVIENKTITVNGGTLNNSHQIRIPRGDQDFRKIDPEEPTPNGWLLVKAGQLNNSGTITAKEPTAPNNGDAIIAISQTGTLTNTGTITAIEGIGLIDDGRFVSEASSSITNLDDGIYLYNRSRFNNVGGTISAPITIYGGRFFNKSGDISGSSFTVHRGALRIKQDSSVASFSFMSKGKYITDVYETNTGGIRDVHTYTLTATGSGTLEPGATIHIREGEEFIDINDGDELTLMRADSGLPTDLSNINLTDYSAVLTFTLKLGGVDNKDIIAVADRTSYEAIGETTIAKEVGTELDIIREEQEAHLRDFLYELERVPTREGINRVLLALAPRQQLSARLLAHNSGLAALSQMTEYRTTRRQALKGIPYKLTINPTDTGFASADKNPGTTLAQALPLTPGEREERKIGTDQMVNIYARATTGYTRVGSGGGRIGLGASRVGAVFGIDMRLHENILIGFTGSYDYNNVEFASNLGNGRINSYRFGPYAMIFHNDWFFESELTLGIHDNRFKRNVVVSGTTYRPKSNFDAIDFTASIGGGYDFHIGGYTITPRANIQYQFYHSNRYSEKNGGDVALKINRYNTNALSTRIGVELWKKFEIEENYLSAVTPFLNVGWRHEWLAPTDLKTQFQEGGSSFNVDNDLFSRNSIYIGAGSSFEISEQLNFDIRYQADLGDRRNISQNAYLSLRYRF